MNRGETTKPRGQRSTVVQLVFVASTLHLLCSYFAFRYQEPAPLLTEANDERIVCWQYLFNNISSHIWKSAGQDSELAPLVPLPHASACPICAFLSYRLTECQTGSYETHTLLRLQGRRVVQLVFVASTLHLSCLCSIGAVSMLLSL